MTFLAIIIHLAWDLWVGWRVASLFRTERTIVEMLTVAFLLGFFIETLLIGCLIFFGLPLRLAVPVVLVLMGLLMPLCSRFAKGKLSPLSSTRLKFYELLVFLVLAEKLVFAIWQITTTPLYFDDALTHWSGRARALYGDVNWSLDSTSPLFMGIRGYDHYPLGIPIWRATTAVFNGSWNDVVARADSPIFFLVSVFAVWAAIGRLTRQRWLAAMGAFVMASLPLQVWHAASGHADIAVQAFAVVSLAALLRSEFMLAGILAAGTVWSKNDGLVIFVPALAVAAAILASVKNDAGRTSLWRKLLCFVLGVATVTPWFVAKWAFGFGMTPNGEGLDLHSKAVPMLLTAVFGGAAHGIFLPALMVMVLWGLPIVRKTREGSALFVCMLTISASIVFIFSATGAFVFLANEATIHRSLLQTYGIAVVLMAYSIAVRLPPDSCPRE